MQKIGFVRFDRAVSIGGTNCISAGERDYDIELDKGVFKVIVRRNRIWETFIPVQNVTEWRRPLEELEAENNVRIVKPAAKP